MKLTSWSDLATHLFQHVCPAVVLSWDNNFVHIQQCDPVISVCTNISLRGERPKDCFSSSKLTIHLYMFWFKQSL